MYPLPYHSVGNSGGMPLEIPLGLTGSQPLRRSGSGLRLPPIAELLSMSSFGNERNSAQRHHSPHQFNTRPDGFIDLTAEPSSPPHSPSLFDSELSEPDFLAFLQSESPQPQASSATSAASATSSMSTMRRSRDLAGANGSNKRRRLNNPTSPRLPMSAQSQNSSNLYRAVQAPNNVLDLSAIEDREALAKLQDEQRDRHVELQKQRDKLVQGAVKAQEPDNNGPFKLGQVQCVICMDNMTDMTATHCGRLISARGFTTFC